jgi:tyrosine-protein phosphatase SIW14
MVFIRNLSPVWAFFVLFSAAIYLTAEPRQAQEQTSPPSEHTMVEHTMGHSLTQRGIPNFGEVTPKLYRGGLPDEMGWAVLARMGVKLVVDTHDASKREEKAVSDLGMEYVAIPWHCPWPKDAVFAKFLKVLRENPDKKVFVHCRLGDDRTGMMIAAYRMADQGWTAEEAMREMQAFGFSRPHHFICPSLAGYERSFPERLKSSPEFTELRSGGGVEKSK